MPYTFEKRDYIKFMPYDLTDRAAGRRHICPICGQKVWSTWGQADKHWQRHGSLTGDYETHAPQGLARADGQERFG